MKKIKKVIAVLLAISVSIGILAMTASAAEPVSVNEDDYTQSAPATRVGDSSRIGTVVWHGTLKWNWFFNWGIAITESYNWASPTFLSASATVSANGCIDRTDTHSTTSGRSVSTEKVYQSVKDGRKLVTFHVCEGYWDLNQPIQTEYYAGTQEF